MDAGDLSHRGAVIAPNLSAIEWDPANAVRRGGGVETHFEESGACGFSPHGHVQLLGSIIPEVEVLETRDAARGQVGQDLQFFGAGLWVELSAMA